LAGTLAFGIVLNAPTMANADEGGAEHAFYVGKARSSREQVLHALPWRYGPTR
jgi:hypothetical protein